ncbi:MAG: hypothetical protein HOW59_19120 [Nonomuraea sp.]|nr:hypothetical protein [Nonomuraea sp.]
MSPAVLTSAATTETAISASTAHQLCPADSRPRRNPVAPAGAAAPMRSSRTR